MSVNDTEERKQRPWLYAAGLALVAVGVVVVIVADPLPAIVSALQLPGPPRCAGPARLARLALGAAS